MPWLLSQGYQCKATKRLSNRCVAQKCVVADSYNQTIVVGDAWIYAQIQMKGCNHTKLASETESCCGGIGYLVYQEFTEQIARQTVRRGKLSDCILVNPS